MTSWKPPCLAWQKKCPVPWQNPTPWCHGRAVSATSRRRNFAGSRGAPGTAGHGRCWFPGRNGAVSSWIWPAESKEFVIFFFWCFKALRCRWSYVKFINRNRRVMGPISVGFSALPIGLWRKNLGTEIKWTFNIISPIEVGGQPPQLNVKKWLGLNYFS